MRVFGFLARFLCGPWTHESLCQDPNHRQGVCQRTSQHSYRVNDYTQTGAWQEVSTLSELRSTPDVEVSPKMLVPNKYFFTVMGTTMRSLWQRILLNIPEWEEHKILFLGFCDTPEEGQSPILPGFPVVIIYKASTVEWAAQQQ